MICKQIIKSPKSEQSRVNYMLVADKSHVSWGQIQQSLAGCVVLFRLVSSTSSFPYLSNGQIMELPYRNIVMFKW